MKDPSLLMCELSMTKDEGRALSIVYDILCSVMGKEKASMLQTFGVYPAENEAMRDVVYLHDGSALIIQKERRRVVTWPRFTQVNLKDFDLIVARRQNDRMRFVAVAAPIHGQDLRMYRILPQLRDGDFAIWTEMQNLFTYCPSPSAIVSKETHAKIRAYIEQATGNLDCLESSNVLENIKQFHSLFWQRPVKRKRFLQNDSESIGNSIVSTIRKGQWMNVFQMLIKYCSCHEVPCRVLHALAESQDQNRHVIADGCLFMVRHETMSICRFSVVAGTCAPLPGWSVLLLQDGVVLPSPEIGVAMSQNDAVFLAKKGDIDTPQVQIWLGDRFVHSFVLWSAWRKMVADELPDPFIKKSLMVLISRVYKPATLLPKTCIRTFLQLLWINCAIQVT